MHVVCYEKKRWRFIILVMGGPRYWLWLKRLYFWHQLSLPPPLRHMHCLVCVCFCAGAPSSILLPQGKFSWWNETAFLYMITWTWAAFLFISSSPREPFINIGGQGDVIVKPWANQPISRHSGCGRWSYEFGWNKRHSHLHFISI